MRFNTKNKRAQFKNRVITLLILQGWGSGSAEYETDNWIKYGLNSLSDTPKRDIRHALITISYEVKK